MNSVRFVRLAAVVALGGGVVLAATATAASAAATPPPATSVGLVVTNSGSALTPVTVQASVTADDGSTPRGTVVFTLHGAGHTYTASVGVASGHHVFPAADARAGTYTVKARYVSPRGAKGRPRWHASRSPVGRLTLARVPVTVTPDDQATVWGQADPTFGYTVSSANPLASSASYLTVRCGVATAHTEAGEYPITCTGTDPTDSFTVTSAPATLTVSAVALTVTDSPVSRAAVASGGSVIYSATVRNAATLKLVGGVDVSFALITPTGTITACDAVSASNGVATCTGPVTNFDSATATQATILPTNDYDAATTTGKITS